MSEGALVFEDQMVWLLILTVLFVEFSSGGQIVRDFKAVSSVYTGVSISVFQNFRLPSNVKHTAHLLFSVRIRLIVLIRMF